jgi:hypothetical protein
VNAAVARVLREMRESQDATFSVIAEDPNGGGIIVLVDPADLPAFVMMIDPANLDAGAVSLKDSFALPAEIADEIARFKAHLADLLKQHRLRDTLSVCGRPPRPSVPGPDVHRAGRSGAAFDDDRPRD